MRKSLLELQYLEEQKLYEELKKVENAEHYYGKLSLFKKLSLMFFMMNIIVIGVGSTYQFMTLESNIILVNFVIMILSLLSLSSLIISNIYKNKTLNVLKQYYEAK